MTFFVLNGVGRFVRDPELRELPDYNTEVTKFTLVFDEVRKNKDGSIKKIAHYLDFEAWSSAAKTVCKWCKKGDQIQISATPRQEKWTDNNGNKRSAIVFRVDKFAFVGGKRKNNKDDEDPVVDANEKDDAPF